jgi:hypothetical protein
MQIAQVRRGTPALRYRLPPQQRLSSRTQATLIPNKNSPSDIRGDLRPPGLQRSRSHPEIHIFDATFAEGVQWYRSHFMTSSQKNGRKILAGESSPSYIYHPHAAKQSRRPECDLTPVFSSTGLAARVRCP